MPRRSSPWFKASHGCHYSRVKGVLVRLDPDYERSVLILESLTRPGRRAPAAAGPTVADVAARYLPACGRRVRPITLRSIRVSIGQLVAGLGAMPAADVGVAEVREWLDAHPWNPSTRWLRATHVRTMFRWAADEEHIPAYRLAKLRRGRMGERAPITEGQWAAFRAAAAGGILADWLDLSIACGARRGELWGLEARHVAREGPWRGRSAIVAGKAGERTIWFPEAVAGLLGRLCAAHPAGPILRGARGQPWAGTSSLGNRFHALSARVGFRVVPHHARSLFASRCYAAGADAEMVRALMGHVPTSVLGRHYLVIPRERLLAAVDAAWGWGRDRAAAG